MRRGDAVVTGFSGTKVPVDVPVDVHPLDRTFIDLDGISARIHDLQNLGSGPRAQLVDVPVLFEGKARDLGQVFGIGLAFPSGQQSPDIYLSATSAYGLQIVVKEADGSFRRTVKGEPNAQFMPGQFGKNGGPGSIWKVDAKSGDISLLTDIKTGGKTNGGAGLGNIKVGPQGKFLFVSDLETGMIHSVSLETGQIASTFDHGVTGRPAGGLDAVPFDEAGRGDIARESFNSEDASTWGFADIRRGVYGVAGLRDRLYYATTDGPEIWSVSIGAGAVIGLDARREFAIKTTAPTNLITHLEFDFDGALYLSSRGEVVGSYDYTLFAKPQQSVVLRYVQTKDGWKEEPGEYAMGLKTDHRATTGGVALNFGYDDKTGRIDLGQCRRTVWATGEHLRAGASALDNVPGGPEIVHGLQGMYKDKVRPANVPPVETWFIDHDKKFEDPAIDGHIGDVAIYNACLPKDAAAPPPVKGKAKISIDKTCGDALIGGDVQCSITLSNTGTALPLIDVTVTDVTRVLDGPGTGDLVAITEAEVDGNDWACSEVPSENFQCTLPAASLLPGTSRTITVTVATADVVADGNSGFRNCARLDGFGGLESCAEGGTPSITIEKTAPATCAPGKPCTFEVTVTNNGDRDLEAPVSFSDQMSVPGFTGPVQISSIVPPLPCTVQPGSIPFACTGTIALEAGESQTFEITVNMPNVGESVLAENCALVADPLLVPNQAAALALLDDRANGFGEQGFLSCTNVPVEPPRCPPGTRPDGNGNCEGRQDPPRPPSDLPPETFVPGTPPPPPIFVPPLRICNDGRTPLANGRCPCPRNSDWNPATQSCERPPIVIVREPCENGFPRDRFGFCQVIARCPDGSLKTSDRRCPDNARPVCPDGNPMPANGFCGCPRGQTVDKNGHCVDRPKICPDGKPVPFNGKCSDTPTKCPDGSPMPANGSCTLKDPPKKCPDGSPMPANGSCTLKDPPKKCPDGSPMPANGSCTLKDPPKKCPDGSPMAANGTCTLKDPPAKCPDGSLKPASGICSNIGKPPSPNETCIGGAKLDANGKCPGDVRKPETCKDGWILNSKGVCVVGDGAPITPAKCPEGQIRVGTGCKPREEITTAKRCPADQKLTNTGCVPIAKPVDKCGKDKVWNGSACVSNTPAKIVPKDTGKPVVKPHIIQEKKPVVVKDKQKDKPADKPKVGQPKREPHKPVVVKDKPKKAPEKKPVKKPEKKPEKKNPDVR